MLKIVHLLSEEPWPANSIEKTAVAKIDAWLSDMTLALHRHAAEPHHHRGAQNPFLHERLTNRDKALPKDFLPQSVERFEHEGKPLLVGVKVASQIGMNATDNHLGPHDELGLHRDQCFP